MSHRRLRWTDEVEQPGRSTPIIRSQIIIGRILHSQQILEWGGCILVSAENELAWMAITVWLITNNNIGRNLTLISQSNYSWRHLARQKAIELLSECRECCQLFISMNKRENSSKPYILYLRHVINMLLIDKLLVGDSQYSRGLHH